MSHDRAKALLAVCVSAPFVFTPTSAGATARGADVQPGEIKEALAKQAGVSSAETGQLLAGLGLDAASIGRLQNVRLDAPRVAAAIVKE